MQREESKSGKIQITPQMIKAGVRELIWLNQGLDSPEMIVSRVVAATLEQAGLVVDQPQT